MNRFQDILVFWLVPVDKGELAMWCLDKHEVCECVVHPGRGVGVGGGEVVTPCVLQTISAVSP